VDAVKLKGWVWHCENPQHQVRKKNKGRTSTTTVYPGVVKNFLEISKEGKKKQGEGVGGGGVVEGRSGREERGDKGGGK